MLNQVHVLKTNNVTYHETNLAYITDLNEVNNMVIQLIIVAENVEKMLSVRRPYSDKSGLGSVESTSSSVITKTKCVKESKLVATEVNTSHSHRSLWSGPCMCDMTCHLAWSIHV